MIAADATLNMNDDKITIDDTQPVVWYFTCKYFLDHLWVSWDVKGIHMMDQGALLLHDNVSLHK